MSALTLWSLRRQLLEVQTKATELQAENAILRGMLGQLLQAAAESGLIDRSGAER